MYPAPLFVPRTLWCLIRGDTEMLYACIHNTQINYTAVPICSRCVIHFYLAKPLWWLVGNPQAPSVIAAVGQVGRQIEIDWFFLDLLFAFLKSLLVPIFFLMWSPNTHVQLPVNSPQCRKTSRRMGQKSEPSTKFNRQYDREEPARTLLSMQIRLGEKDYGLLRAFPSPVALKIKGWAISSLGKERNVSVSDESALAQMKRDTVLFCWAFLFKYQEKS